MKIYLNKRMIEMLKWVLAMFIDTHSIDGEIYADDIKEAKKILDLIN